MEAKAQRRAIDAPVALDVGDLVPEIPALIATAPAELEFVGSVPAGGAWALDGLWRRLGIHMTVERLLAARRLDVRAERLLFAMVANRALAPFSKVACCEWLAADVAIPRPAAEAVGEVSRSCSSTDNPNRCRAMATFVYEAAKQPPRMTMVHRPIETTRIIEHEIVVTGGAPQDVTEQVWSPPTAPSGTAAIHRAGLATRRAGLNAPTRVWDSHDRTWGILAIVDKRRHSGYT